MTTKKNPPVRYRCADDGKIKTAPRGSLLEWLLTRPVSQQKRHPLFPLIGTRVR